MIVPCHASTEMFCLPFSLSAALRLQLHRETMRLQARLTERKKYGATSPQERTLDRFLQLSSGARMIILLLLALLFVVMCNGCATIPEIVNLKQDESFTHDEIVAGKMVVGGVVSIVNDLDELESSKYADMLRDSFLSVRKEFVILPVEEVVQRLGKELYQKILYDYKYTGELNLDFLKKLESCQTAFRYLLLVRIIENEVSERTEKRPRPEIPPKTDWKGNPIVKKIDVVMIATRRIIVSLDIYDLKKRILALSGEIDESKSKERSPYYEEKDEDIVKSFKLIPVRAFLGVVFQPSAPSTEKLLHNIFKAIVQNMPCRHQK